MLHYTLFAMQLARTYATTVLSIILTGILLGMFPLADTQISNMQWSVENNASVLTLTLYKGSMASPVYRVHPSVCVTQVYANNVEIAHEKLCDSFGELLDLSDAIRSGQNTIALHFERNEKHINFSLKPTSLYPPTFFLYISTFVSSILTIVLVAAAEKKMRYFGCIATAFLGICLQIFYVSRTPYFVRAWDWDGHVQYIQYMLQHWSVPPIDQGFEFFQPPLYYFLSALWVRMGNIVGIVQGMDFIQHVQVLSVILISSSVVSTFWIARNAFSKANQKIERALLVLTVAVFPGIVFASSRINNDVLLLALSYLSFATLLHWWRTGKANFWYANCVILGIGFLTKTSMLPLFGIAGLSLLLRPHQKVRTILMLGGVGIGIVLLLAGWLWFLRIAFEEQRHVVGNLSLLNSALKDTTSPDFFTFNPLEIINRPFNLIWNESFRRSIFWENLLKSAYVGEWNHAQETRLILQAALALNLLAIPLVLTGFIGDLRTSWRANAPFWLALLILPSAALANRIICPSFTCQDFRFIPLIIVPFTYFVLRSAQFLGSHGRTIIRLFVGTFCVICILYVLAITIFGSVHP